MSPATVVYLVTKSECYYPGSGTEDWILCTPDETAARARYEQERHSEWYIVHLIAIDSNGRYVELAGPMDD